MHPGPNHPENIPIMSFDLNNLEYADFTTTGGVQRTCDRCDKAGIQLFFICDRNPMKAGKALCDPCRKHYTHKRDPVEHEDATREHTQSVYVRFPDDVVLKKVKFAF